MSVQLNPNQIPPQSAYPPVSQVRLIKAEEGRERSSSMESLSEEGSSKTYLEHLKDFGEAFLQFFTDIIQGLKECVLALFTKSDAPHEIPPIVDSRNEVPESSNSPDELPPLPVHPDLIKLREVVQLLDNTEVPVKTVLDKIYELPKDILEGANGLFHKVFENLEPKKWDSDTYGEDRVNANPRDPEVAKVIKGFVHKQERAFPLKELLDLHTVLSQEKISKEEFIKRFDQLPAVYKPGNFEKVDPRFLQDAILDSICREVCDLNIGDLIGARNWLEHSAEDSRVADAIRSTIRMYGI